MSRLSSIGYLCTPIVYVHATGLGPADVAMKQAEDQGEGLSA
jgi:hypothetical protein